jgi:hypothetical protein
MRVPFERDVTLVYDLYLYTISELLVTLAVAVQCLRHFPRLARIMATSAESCPGYAILVR